MQVNSSAWNYRWVFGDNDEYGCLEDNCGSNYYGDV